MQTDYLVIGQGLAGTLLSFHMEKNGIDHVVVDVPMEDSATRAAAGLINPIFNGLGSWGGIMGPYLANELVKMILDSEHQPFEEVTLARFERGCLKNCK